MKKAIVLWTGGKDSCLAMILAREAGWEIAALVTFIPAEEVEFKAHPQSEIREQACKLGISLEFVKIAEPYRDSYISALTKLKTRYNLDGIITGDIDLIEGQPNWIEECCRGIEVDVVRPLWKMPRVAAMEKVLAYGIRARISFINHPAIPSSWLNRTLDKSLIEELRALAHLTGIDLAGENGEYHTMVEI